MRVAVCARARAPRVARGGASASRPSTGRVSVPRATPRPGRARAPRALAIARARSSVSSLAPTTTRAPIKTMDAYVARVADFVPPAAFAATLGAFAFTAIGFMLGCLLTLRELVRACREATLASRAVRNCANSIEVSCASVDRCTKNIDATCAKVDDFLEQANTIGTTTSNILTEAGLLQRRVSELPNALLGSLGDSAEDPRSRSFLAARGADGAELAAEMARRDIVLGKEITGRRLGNGWIGSTMHRFFFSRDNTFSVGEYVAVKRSNNTYTWGVVEAGDSDESEDGKGVDGTESSSDSAVDVSQAEPAVCEWPPRDYPAEAAAKEIEEANKITPMKVFKALIRMPLPKNLGEPERQYRVVVEVDRDLYRFKYVDASLLGKRY